MKKKSSTVLYKKLTGNCENEAHRKQAVDQAGGLVASLWGQLTGWQSLRVVVHLHYCRETVFAHLAKAA